METSLYVSLIPRPRLIEFVTDWNINGHPGRGNRRPMKASYFYLNAQLKFANIISGSSTFSGQNWLYDSPKHCGPGIIFLLCSQRSGKVELPGERH